MGGSQAGWVGWPARTFRQYQNWRRPLSVKEREKGLFQSPSGLKYVTPSLSNFMFYYVQMCPYVGSCSPTLEVGGGASMAWRAGLGFI
uniref:Uncharacterized protein n=1 Tax=Picea glauca TaxID=3330 RepID=A0A124GP65_PICGL|nr:hypothetical protein ABT39_MTgene839 [Picea glauca]